MVIRYIGYFKTKDSNWILQTTDEHLPPAFVIVADMPA